MGSGPQLQIAFFAHATPLCYISNFQPEKLGPPWQNPGSAPGSYSLYYIQKHTKLLSSATKLQQSNISQASVSHSVQGGVCLSACWDTPFGKIHPSGQVHLLAGIHPPPGRYNPPVGTPPPTTVTAVDGTHPTGIF